MLKRTIFYILFKLIIIQTYGSSFPTHDVLKELYHPIDQGGEIEKKIINLLEKYCEENSIRYEKTRVENEDVLTNSFIFEVLVNETKESDFSQIVFIPLNSPYYEGKYYDISISQWLAFSLLERCKESPLKHDLRFVFYGGGGEQSEHLWGLKQYIQNNEGLFDSARIHLIDLIGDRGDFYLHGSIPRRAISSDVLKVFFNTANKYVFARFDILEIFLARLGVNNLSPEAKLLMQFSPIVLTNHNNYLPFKGGYYGEKRNSLSLDFLYDWLCALDSLPKKFDVDVNYQYFKFGKSYYFISEFAQVIFFMIFFVVIIFMHKIIFLFRSSIQKAMLSSLPYYLFIFLIYFAISVIIILIGIIYNDFTFDIADYSRISAYYFFVVFFISLLIILLFLDKIEKVAHIRRNFVYINGAVLFAAINFIISLFVSISIAYIYLLILFFLVVSHLTGKYIILKYFTYCLAFLPFIVGIIALSFGLGNILSGNIKELLFMQFLYCYFSFPLILLAIRIAIINKLKFGIVMSRFVVTIWIIIILISFFVVNTLALIGTIHLEKKASVTATYNYITNMFYLNIESFHKGKAVPVEYMGVEKKVNPGKTVKFEIIKGKKPYKIEVSKENNYVLLDILSSLPFYDIDVILKRSGSQTIEVDNYRYDFEYNEETNESLAKIHIPKNSGKKIMIKFQTSSMLNFNVETEITYLFKDLTDDLKSGFDYSSYMESYKEDVFFSLD